MQRARALKNLSLAFEARRSFHSRRNHLPDSPSPTDPLTAVRTFAQRVADEIDSGTLLYSRRLRLLNEAHRKGIRRFDANLIIAAVQDRAPASTRPHLPRGSSLAARVAIALFTQTILLLGAWYIVYI